MEPWRKRLLEAVKKDGRSYSEILREANLSKSFITEVLVDDEPNDPRLSNVMKLCDTLGVSFAWVVTGIRMSKEAQEYLKLFSTLPDGDRQTLLRLSRSMLSDAGIPEPDRAPSPSTERGIQPARRQTN